MVSSSMWDAPVGDEDGHGGVVILKRAFGL